MGKKSFELSVFFFCFYGGTVNDSKLIDASSHWCFLGRVRKRIHVLR